MTKGAEIIRVHDVAETKQAVEVYHAMTNGVISE
jgi:dihydropteroate synthase